jgi:hypothetical protein
MKHCKGCRSEVNCKKYTDIMKKIDIDKCACATCLIKVVCNDPCDDFINLFKKYYEKDGKGYLTLVWCIKKYEYKGSL